MSTTEFVVIPPWDDETPDMPRFVVGQRVRHIEIHWPNSPATDFRNPKGGLTGTVVQWGRGITSDAHWREQHDPVLRCVYGESCDALVDSEGPVVHWDGDSEELDWYPGQAMTCIEEIS
jgi:hypothetical protein